MNAEIIHFATYFKAYKQHYVIIGANACILELEPFGEDFRATKDLDIVIIVEALSAEFIKTFWEFVRQAGYKAQQGCTGAHTFYRFKNPEDKKYPTELELFARAPNTFALKPSAHLTPIPTAEIVELSSLSAILLDDTYYSWILENKREAEDIPYITIDCLIPLKIKAWLDLVQRQAEDTVRHIQQHHIKKHKRDIVWLSRFLPSDPLQKKFPKVLQEDLQNFIAATESAPDDIKNILGTAWARSPVQTKQDFINILRAYFLWEHRS